MREIATALIEALRTQPATLALSVSNLALLGFIFYALSGAADTRERLVQQITANSDAIHQMLRDRSACPAPG
jgi:Tfp pilus assembly protein PilV